jgi:glyoxylase-like metal-dependent hydrolase (beta-lactamase superfamily II)
MEMFELALGGRLYHFDTGPFNWYLISQDGRLTLVDAGFPGHYPVFLNGIRSLGYSIKDLEAIILTHAHADHTGFAEKLREAVNIPVFIHKDDLATSKGLLNLPWVGLLTNVWRPYVVKIFGHATWNGIFSMPRLTKAYAFKDGDRLDVPGKPRVIHIPGHTLGEVVFYLPESGILLSGDTIITRDLMTGAEGQPRVPSSVLNGNNKEARRSIDRLSDLGLVTVLPGHGRPWKGSMSEVIEIALSSGSSSM